MNWNIETGKQISMTISIVVMILMVIKYRKTGKENLFFIIGYLLFSLIDISCYFYFKLTNLPTDIFYVIGFLMIVFFLYLLYYYQLLYVPLLKKIQTIILVLFVLNIVVMFYTEDDLLHHFSFNMLYADILLLLFSIILFLYQTFNSDKILEIKNYLPFWISVSLMIFFIGSIPILFFRTTVSETIYFFILFMLNLISNGILILGLIWNKQERTR
ncbi:MULTISPECIES: hypothetical protein [Chryseobacterium]|uniref:hypothetical protein n=1 Tax=Chryseobacterium TaxID=59732 RepID=UPI000D71A736|nr:MULTISPECIES: hypothetical protein [Chryseobacterium]PWW28660.1 hypothetical protein DEU40_104172 [Chryseobacterium sp. AG844]QRA44036.1 hypothetical protein JNG87_04575 [Chryseobacterium cucumeris]RKE78615.1 hypothetical protein DEU39_2863 [Chryseobacterium sp. AG363]